jgi:hypothetical protein
VLGLLLLLVPRMHMFGAATALLCASLIRLAAIITAYRLVLEQPLPRLWPNAEDVRYLRSRFTNSAGIPARQLVKEA